MRNFHANVPPPVKRFVRPAHTICHVAYFAVTVYHGAGLYAWVAGAMVIVIVAEWMVEE